MLRKHKRLRPNVPRNITAKSATSNQVSFSWDAVKGATSYNVYRFYAKIATVSKNSYTSNPNLKPDTAYIFNVSAVNSAGESDRSDNFTIRTEKES
ncbi:fibronectin type III domain-containing protein [Bacillus velezensis]|uniref:fibronectin type III domain-containing protein n=1 Tax=Bacillus velezensis TaxID=492670 RepID=UPI002DB6B12A|nr:fibronectin type III domain-containing protein [Bacillus velezensis]MEC3772190.1 fibronectin type III domain-containing protein [Bacillus velezensis]